MDTSGDRRRWRLLLETEPRSGAWNMAIDRAMMEAAGEGIAPPTLRLYQWSPPAVSLGKGQPFTVADLGRCRAAGVDVVQRPTGGWAIFHTDELTYSVAAHSDEPAVAGPLLEAYKTLSAALIAGLQRLGLDASLAPAPAPSSKEGLIACFAVPYNNEITVAGESSASGKKLMGSAQARNQRRLLQHGSLPLTGDVSRAVDYLIFPNEDAREELREHLREHATTASDAAGRIITFAEAAAALCDGFTAALNIDLVPETLTQGEFARATQLVAEMESVAAVEY
ncbi:MAG TPA: lipoate--protein ligase family protein [Ktedonobacterales bacterium]|nr:lipoate--protein ligase family protein [Ktedonobacterales bacterium]